MLLLEWVAYQEIFINCTKKTPYNTRHRSNQLKKQKKQ
jgi:hypothetical protein